MRTLRICLSAAILLSGGAAYAQDISDVVKAPYGKSSALIMPKQSRSVAQATSQNRGRQAYVYYTQKCEARAGYDECMRRWKLYCDNVGRQGKMPGRFISMAASFIPFGGIASELGSWASDEASYSENACHYAQRSYSDKYEYERTKRDNEEFLRQQREDFDELALKIEESQKRLVEISAKAAALETAMELTKVIKEIDASEGRANPPAAAPAPIVPPKPVPAKPLPATPEGKEVPSVQAPVKPQPKAEAPKSKEATPPVSPSKAEPKKLPRPRFAPSPDMAKASHVHPDIAFNPVKNRK